MSAEREKSFDWIGAISDWFPERMFFSSNFFLGKEHSLFAPFMSKAHSLSVLNLWNNYSLFALIQLKNYYIFVLIRSKNNSWNSLFNRFTILIWWLFDIRTNLILRLFWNWVYSGRRTFGWKTIQSLLTLPIFRPFS